MLPDKNTPESQERSAERRGKTELPDGNPQIAFTQVPNAHASGVGSMGRNDEKLPSSPDEVEVRLDPAY